MNNLIANYEIILGSRISESKFRGVLRLFCIDIEVKKLSEITGISRVTKLTSYLTKIRERIALKCEKDKVKSILR